MKIFTCSQFQRLLVCGQQAWGKTETPSKRHDREHRHIMCVRNQTEPNTVSQRSNKSEVFPPPDLPLHGPFSCYKMSGLKLAHMTFESSLCPKHENALSVSIVSSVTAGSPATVVLLTPVFRGQRTQNDSLPFPTSGCSFS